MASTTPGDAAIAPATTASEAPAVAAPPAEETVSLRTPRGRALLMAFLAAHMSHHVSNSLLNPLLPFIRDSFALSYAQAGFLVSAFSLSVGFSNAPIGVLADRVGARRVVAVGLVLTGLMSASLALAGAYWQLLVLLVLMGIIAGSYHAPSAALITRAFPASVRGMVMGLHITGGHLSFFAAPLVAALLISQTGTWYTPYVWFAFAPILTGALIWRLAPAVHQRTAGGTDRFAVFRETWNVVRMVGPLVSASILFQIVYAALFAFLTLYLVDARGFPGPLAAALFGVPMLVGMLGAPLGGYISDYFGRRAVILIGLGGLGPALLALALVPNELIVVPLGAVGLAAALRQTVTEVLVMDSAPAHRRATVLGAYYMLSQELGGAATPFLGLLAGTIGIGAAYGGACFLVAVLSGLVLLFQRKL